MIPNQYLSIFGEIRKNIFTDNSCSDVFYRDSFISRVKGEKLKKPKRRSER